MGCFKELDEIEGGNQTRSTLLFSYVCVHIVSTVGRHSVRCVRGKVVVTRFGKIIGNDLLFKERMPCSENSKVAHL